LDILNCTFYNNHAGYGPAVFSSTADLTTKNCIFWDADLQGDEVSIRLDEYVDEFEEIHYSTATIECSDVRGGEDNIYVSQNSTLAYAGTNLNVDPDFQDDNLHLEPTSPLIDAACGDPVGRDIDNGYRAVGEGVDIGADEQDCFPTGYSSMYEDWATLGRPDCWCNSAVLGQDISDTGPANYTAGDYQCDGDANTDRENPLAKWRVSASDLSIVTMNWNKTIDDPTLDPCADIDHQWENPMIHWRVSASDLSRVITNWKKTAAQLPGDCPRSE
jgi:hypothetical protein